MQKAYQFWDSLVHPNQHRSLQMQENMEKLLISSDFEYFSNI